jgi:hypothetical protein
MHHIDIRSFEVPHLSIPAAIPEAGVDYLATALYHQ